DLQARGGVDLDQTRLQIGPRFHAVAVDAQDAIAARETRQGLRARRQRACQYRVDLDRRADPYARDRREAAIDEEGEQDVHRDAGKDHRHARPQRFLLERAFRIDRHRGLAAFELAGHPLVFQSGHLHVAAERNPRDPVLGLPTRPGNHRTAEAEREAQHLNPHRLRDEEVPQLVHEDQHAEHDDERQQRQQHATSRASWRASASAASTLSSVSPAPGRPRATTYSMIWAMRPNGICSSRNSCTATSLAALNIAGAFPPLRAASRPTTYAGKRSGSSASNVSVPAATGSTRATPCPGPRWG